MKKPTTWYSGNELLILEQTKKFLVIHKTNVRWFLTNIRGAQLLRQVEEQQKIHFITLFSCSKSEAFFLTKLINFGFFLDALNVPSNIPLVINLSLTERCNLECPYCFYAASYRSNKTALHIREFPIKNLQKFLYQIAYLNPKTRFYLTGGEPFLSRNLDLCIQLLKYNNFFIGIVTNATILTEKRVREMSTAGVNEIRVSIDGIKKETHEKTRPQTFEKVMNSLKLLACSRIATILSMTITKYNQKEMLEIAKFAYIKGFSVNYSHFVPTGRGNKNIDIMPDYSLIIDNIEKIEEYFGFDLFNIEHEQGQRRYTCGLAGQSLYINLKGELYSCNMLQNPMNFLGNVFERDVEEIINSVNVQKMRISVDEMLFCNECHLKYICGGSCRAVSLAREGTPKSKSLDCSYKYQEIISSMFRKANYIPN